MRAKIEQIQRIFKRANYLLALEGRAALYRSPKILVREKPHSKQKHALYRRVGEIFKWREMQKMLGKILEFVGPQIDEQKPKNVDYFVQARI